MTKRGLKTKYEITVPELRSYFEDNLGLYVSLPSVYDVAQHFLADASGDVSNIARGAISRQYGGASGMYLAAGFEYKVSGVAKVPENPPRKLVDTVVTKFGRVVLLDAIHRNVDDIPVSNTDATISTDSQEAESYQESHIPEAVQPQGPIHRESAVNMETSDIIASMRILSEELDHRSNYSNFNRY